MRRLALVACSVFLAVYCFYTIGEAVIGSIVIRPITLFPIFTVGGTLALLSFGVPRWVYWIGIGLNAILLLAFWDIILFRSPPLWWTLLIGIGLASGTAVANIAALAQRAGSNNRWRGP